jgi:hypothetical protein
MKARDLIVSTAVLFLLFTNTSGQRSETVELTGQVVCSLCWFEATDRKANRYGTPADITCAAECSENGLPQTLAVEDEKGFTLYTMEKGAVKMQERDFLHLVPKTVTLRGEVRKECDKNFIKDSSYDILTKPALKPVPVSDDAVLSLKDMAGVDQSLAGLRGRVVLLNFWATL